MRMAWTVVAAVMVGLGLGACAQQAESPRSSARKPWFLRFEERQDTGETELVKGGGKILDILPEEGRLVVQTDEGLFGWGQKQEFAWWDRTTVMLKQGRRIGVGDLRKGDQVTYHGTRANDEIHLRRLMLK